MKKTETDQHKIITFWRMYELIIKKQLIVCTCERCGHEWIPCIRKGKQNVPKACAGSKCKSLFWNKKDAPKRGRKPVK